MAKTTEESNKALILEAFDTLFSKRDYKAAERYWSSNYIQHSAHIAPGRDGLFNLVRSMPPTLKYEPGVIVAENDYVIIHGLSRDAPLPIGSASHSTLRDQLGLEARITNVPGRVLRQSQFLRSLSL
jgi:predicted SnoaL-like aldol condensation-catalyzing enzyme